MRIVTKLWVGVVALLLGNTAFSQQLKLGLNPYTIQKSALLEMNSTNQGLLLPRIADTTSINGLTPPDGMVIFFSPTRQLMVRSNGGWQPVTVSGGAIASLNGLTTPVQTFAVGTSGADFSVASSGSVHTFNLPSASATARGVVTTGTQVFAGPKSFTSAMNVSATNPLGLYGVQLGTNTSTDSVLTISAGVVKKLPASTFSTVSGITSLNGLTAATQTFGVGTSGTDFSISSSGSAHTFNIPDASATARGVVTTAGQTFAGVKTFSSAPIFSSLPAGGVHYSGTGGAVSQSTSFVWDATNSRLGIGTSAPGAPLHINGTNPLLLTGVQLGTNTSADSVLTISAGVVKKLPASTFATAANFWALGGNTTGGIRSVGTLDNNALPFITNGAERMRISNVGQVGVGVTDPANPLVVKDTLEIRRTGALSTLLFSNTSGTGDFRIGSDGGDLFWQGGGGRSLQMGAFWNIVLAGDRQTGTFPAIVNGTLGTGVLVAAQRDASVPLAVQANSASQSANLTEWRSNTGTVLNAIDKSGNLGLGTSAPSSRLTVYSSNPMSLFGVPLGTNTSTDSVLTLSSGVVKKLPASTFASASNVWALGGNAVGTAKNLGTTDANALPFITNNVERMRISPTGGVAIGTSTFDATNPEKLLVDAGTTTSYNVFEAHGRINNYLQMNIQNDSAGTNSSSDLVATANNGNENVNYVDLGINSSAFTGTGVIGGANNAYLYSTGNDFSIGNGTSGRSLTFFTGGLASNERMRIDGNGKVGIATTAPAATLDAAGTYKMGATGTVQKNTISFVYTLPTNLIVPAGSLSLLGLGGFSANGGNLDVAIPSGTQPSSTRATVTVSPDQDLGASVSISYSRLTSTSNVRIRFMNASTSGATLSSGMNLYITITEF